MDDSALARVEQQRLDLESNIAKLKKSLRHWQTLEIDYEGLKEEFFGLHRETPPGKCLKVGKEFGAELVDEKELRELVGEDTGVRRRPDQIVELLSKRVEYVSRNISTIKKQLSDAEKKRNALLLAEEPDFRDDAGLPLTEITEELDDDGVVISSKTQTADSTTPQLVEVLKKAGVQGITEHNGKVVAADSHAIPLKTTTNADPPTSAVQIPSASLPPDTGRDHDQSHISEEIATNSGPARVQGDSEEEATLRQEMLQYGLGEVGAIVAELDLEEDEIDMPDANSEQEDTLSFDSDLDDDDDLDDESEDEFGKSKNPIISASYQRKMKALEKKHGISGMSNLGPTPDLPRQVKDQINRPPPTEAARKAALARAETAVNSTESVRNREKKKSTQNIKKKVAFASNLDIAPDVEPQILETIRATEKATLNSSQPIGDTIVERSVATPNGGSRPTSSSSGQVSRFKSARSTTPQTPMFSPPRLDFPEATNRETEARSPVGKILESSIVERPAIDERHLSAPPGEDDIDDALHRREIAAEYHKMRNRMIHHQGGFVHDGEMGNYGDATVALPEEDEETGKIKKVSRFKAARMK